MPEGLSVFGGVGAARQIAVDVLQRRFDPVENVAQFLERRSGEKNVIGPKTVRFGQAPRFVCALAMAAPTEPGWPPRPPSYIE